MPKLDTNLDKLFNIIADSNDLQSDIQAIIQVICPDFNALDDTARQLIKEYEVTGLCWLLNSAHELHLRLRMSEMYSDESQYLQYIEEDKAKYDVYCEKITDKLANIYEYTREQLVKRKVDEKLALVKNLIGSVSAEEFSGIIGDVAKQDRARIKTFLFNKISVNILKTGKFFEDYHLIISSSDTKDYHRKIAYACSSKIAELITNELFVCRLSEEQLKLEINRIISEYKNALIRYSQEITDTHFEKLAKLRSYQQLDNIILESQRSEIWNNLKKKLNEILYNIVPQRQRDVFSLLLFWSGNPTNSVILTLLQNNCMPFITIVLRILSSIYGPILGYYEDIYAKRDKLKQNHNYNFVKVVETTSQLIVPALVMGITFVYLAPLFNDFLLALIIPACMSLIIKGATVVVEFIYNYRNQKNRDETSPRLINIFGEKTALAVKGFYLNQIRKLNLRIKNLEDKRELCLSEDEKNILNIFRLSLKELQNEWRLFTSYNECELDITTESAKKIYQFRCAQYAGQKITKQRNLYKHNQTIFKAMSEKLAKGMMHELSRNLDVVESPSQQMLQSPVAFTNSELHLYQRLIAKQQTRQEKVNHCQKQLESMETARKNHTY